MRDGIGPLGTLELERYYSRACLCFLPLCVVGGASYTAVCRNCGSHMPASTLVHQRRFLALAPLPFAPPPHVWLSAADQPFAGVTHVAVSEPAQPEPRSYPPAGGECEIAAPLPVAK